MRPLKGETTGEKDAFLNEGLKVHEKERSLQ